MNEIETAKRADKLLVEYYRLQYKIKNEGSSHLSINELQLKITNIENTIAYMKREQFTSLYNRYDIYTYLLNEYKWMIKEKEALEKSIKLTLPLTTLCLDKDVLRLIQREVYKNEIS